MVWFWPKCGPTVPVGHDAAKAPPCSRTKNRSAKRRPLRRPLQLESLESRNFLAASLSVPQLSSRPQADATLYLDFNGHVEQRWGSHTNVTTPAYDTDGNKSSFSTAELAAIREIWARVAEDYAPFNINVTTVAPPAIADRVAARVAIGGSYSDWYGSSAGGVSYVGGFAGPSSNVAYVFSSTLGSGNPRFVAEAASHEAGHLFGLEHKATWNGSRLVAEYSSGTDALAPIMGVGYYADRTTWTAGATADGPAVKQDDLAVLASSVNGFGYAPDDHGNTLATASPFSVSDSSVGQSGQIGVSGDRDLFKFTTGGGQLSFRLDVATYGPNLDAIIELQNSTGQMVTYANPSSSFGASLTATVGAGTYYLVVRSTGGYGNLGRYSLDGTVPRPTTTTTPPPTSTPTTLPPTLPYTPPPTSSTPTSTPTTTPRISDNGAASFTSTGIWRRLSGIGYASDTQSAAANSSATSTWTFSGLAPGKYRLSATWQASALNATDAPFVVSNSGRLLGTARVNQQRSASSFTSGGSSWQNLGTFTISGNSLTIRLNSSTSGRVIADALRLERVA